MIEDKIEAEGEVALGFDLSFGKAVFDVAAEFGRPVVPLFGEDVAVLVEGAFVGGVDDRAEEGVRLRLASARFV